VLADRIVVMANGEIEQAGTPEDIYERPETEFVAQFIGRCNVLPGKLVGRDRVDISGVFLRAEDRAAGIHPGQSVALSVRPHSIIMDPIDCGIDPNSANCFTVQVQQQSYCGEFREYRVQLEQSEVCLSVVTAPDIHHQVGDRLVVKIPPEHCRIVPSRRPQAQQSKTEVLTVL
jgi:iron(III) transport system ATP-binding protein